MQVADELEKLVKLRDEGLISDGVFSRAKSTLLGSPSANVRLADELRKLAKLRANGVISGEELVRQELALLGPVPSTSGPVKKQAKPLNWAKGCGCIALLVIALGILGAMFGSDTKTKAPAGNATPSSSASPTPKPTPTIAAERDAPSEPQAMHVTTTELFNAYDANEAAAQRRYGHQSLLVSGTVNGVDLDMFDKPSVKLKTPNQFLDAQATLTSESQERADTLRKGQKIELLCASVGEVMSVPMLKGCSIQ